MDKRTVLFQIDAHQFSTNNSPMLSKYLPHVRRAGHHFAFSILTCPLGTAEPIQHPSDLFF